MRELFFLFYFLCFGWGGVCQDGIYKFNHLSTTEGLSQSSAISFHQDDFGQMWIGTRDGLNKYNGSEFTVYRHNKKDKNSISNNYILCLEQDSFGFIWVGTSIGLNKYNLKKDTFQSFFSDNTDESIIDNTIWDIKEMSNNEIWIGTPKGLSIYDKETDTFNNLLKNKGVLSIYETQKGHIFIGTLNGIIEVTKTANNSFLFKKIEGTENEIVQEFIEDIDGDLLIGTRESSVLEYNIDKKKITPYFKKSELNGKNRNVRKLLFDDDNLLWIASYSGLQIANGSRELKVIYSDINNKESINDNFIKSLYKDEKGSIWVGTYYGGINIWDKANSNFINFTQKPGQSGLSFNVISSIENYKDLIIFGTEGGGVTIYNTISNTYEYLTKKSTSVIRNNNIKALCLTQDETLWIGSYKNGLVVYNLKTKTFDKNTLSKDLINYIGSTGVSSIEEFDENTVLIGTYSKGVLKYNVRSKLFEVFNPNTSSLTPGMVKALAVDRKRNIWVGTLKGLNIIDTLGTIKTHFYQTELKTGQEVTALYEDINGVMWIGTEVSGLYKFLGNRFQSLDLKIDNNELNGFRSIIEDDSSNLWIGTSNQGLINYDPSHDTIIAHYTQKEGLESNQFNYNARLKVSSDNYIFGGLGGAISFNPNNLVKNDYAPQVIITGLKIKNKLITVNDDNQLLTKTIPYTRDLELSYQQGNFSISFSIPNFINSKGNRYKYRLIGLEDEWIDTDKNSAAYTIQKPGNYIFEVKGVNNDGVVNDKATSLYIKVNPAPWRTWWAFLIYGLLTFAMLYFLINILKSKTKLKHQLDLEQLEIEQTKATNIAKLEFFTNISHEFRTPLTLILGPLHQILDNYRGSSAVYKKLKVVESSANHLLQLINRLMDFRKFENNLFKLEAAEGNIIKFIKEIYLSFSEYAKDGKYNYTFVTEKEEILVYYDRYKLERVFYNLISNAFRYTPKGGNIVLRVLEENGFIIIRVEDSGVGITEEYQDKIFERFFELSLNNKPDNDYNKGTGIGLSIVKNIVKLHKGKINVYNNENNKGSIFSVELPLGRNHLDDTEIIKNFKFSDDVSQYINQLDKKQIITEENILDDKISEEKLTVLLVEDNKPLRKFIKSLLVKEYNILQAENGKVAIKIAQTEQVDLIVSDVVMPIMTGTELCALVKKDIRTSHIPIILLTSRSSLIYKLEGLESGADDYISKPFNVNEFELRIKNILNSISRLKQKLNATETLQPDDIVLSSLDEKLYAKALQIVENNIANEQFDIPFFCEELGVSRTVLFRKVKAWTDFTPNEFIQHLRLKKAAQLLELDKLNISQISYQVGFKNPKYFSKCFRKKFGKTPTQYLKTFSLE